MRQGIYMGDIAHLQGKTALLRNVEPIDHDRVLAQFDDRNLTRSGKPIPKDTVLDYEPHARFPTEQQVDYPTPPNDCLGFNWHEFAQDEFLEYIQL